MSGPLFNSWAFLPNIASLRLLGGLTLCDQAADVVNVIGYYSPSVTSTPDGGGGIFVYDATDTTTADDGGVTIVDTVGRRWKRQFDGGTINVLWFGALPDFTTNPNALPINLAAFQAALDFMANGVAKLSLYHDLYIPTGSYVIGGSLTQKSGIRWRGDGKQVYSSQVSGGTTIVFDFDPSPDDLGGIVLDSGLANGSGADAVTFTDLEIWGVASDTTKLHHAILLVDGPFFQEGGINRVQFTGWTGYCVYWQSGGTPQGIPYFQNMVIEDVTMTGVGGFIGTDPGAIQFTNARFININHENSLNTGAGTMPVWCDCTTGRELTIENVICEPTGTIPYIFRFGNNAWYYVNYVHIEFITVSTAVIRLENSLNGQHQLNYFRSFVAGNIPAFISFADTANNYYVELRDISSGITDINDLVIWGAGTGNSVVIRDIPTGGFDLSSNLISKLQFQDLKAVCGASVTQSVYATQVTEPFIYKRGEWLDGAFGGPVTLKIDQPTTTVADIGMFTDANEGRVFELVSNANFVPNFYLDIASVPEMVGNQIAIGIRYYFDTADTEIGLPLLPQGANQIATTEYSATGSFAAGPASNQWNTGYFIGYIPNTTATQIGSVITPTKVATGVWKLRIAAIWVAAAKALPYLIAGGPSTGAITWTAAAAPTYGDYLVGDRVNNSVPAVGQPLGWVCTVAGSPGTWVALANL